MELRIKVLKGRFNRIKIAFPKSFATHLLKSRMSLRYIQELFGYKSSKITKIYIHISIRNAGTIKNSLDNLFLEKEGELG